MIGRRMLMAGSAAFAAPVIAGANSPQVLRFVPRWGLAQLDPVATTDAVTRQFGIMVFESLYSVDAQLNPRPQMVEGHVIENGGKRWTMHLREGLRFHDGEPVLARDCVASVNRWLARDLLARSLRPRLDAVEALDDHTLVFRLNRAFPHLAFALGKAQPNILPIMPSRLAETDPARPVAEVIGSGPFRFLPDHFVIGSFAAFAPFDGYSPRNDPPTGTAGGRRVRVARVEWNAISDPGTAAAALLTGEVDWIDAPLADLLPRLRQNRNVTVDVIDQFGFTTMLRLNHASGPTANRGIRQAIMAAIDQAEIMQAVTGGDPKTYTIPAGVFAAGGPCASDAGFDRLGPRGTTEVRAMLDAAGYRGDRLVLLHPTDNVFANAASGIIVSRLRECGLNVDDVAMDQGTLIQRRNSREPPERGGWSMFALNPSGVDHLDPLVALGLRNGAAAWIGWPNNLRLEELRDAWINSQDPEEQRRIAAAIQAVALEDVTYVPLGQYVQPSAWRNSLQGIVRANVPIFWNIEKA